MEGPLIQGPFCFYRAGFFIARVEFGYSIKVIVISVLDKLHMRKINLLIFLLVCLPSAVFADQPNFALPDLNGKIHHLSDYRGKWVVVNYWATWCPPCLDEIPELEEFHAEHHKRDAIVVGVNYEDDDPASLKSFVAENMISYPILRADLTRPPVFGQLYGLPTSFIISPDGKLIKSKTGEVTKAFLEGIINQYNKSDLVVEK
jgi:thiol-disulfide isomerase/thioredoxin